MLEIRTSGKPRRYEVYAIDRPSGDQVGVMFSVRFTVTRRWFAPS